VTPLLEPLETVAAGVGAARQSGLFRFMDSDGALLALVGERTVSVARVVATQLHDGPFPLRLCYAGSVLRNQALNTGRRRESMQAGCELVGATGLAADAECKEGRAERKGCRAQR
jgi:ATP phosphoribosyltransferase regulatory subunit